MGGLYRAKTGRDVDGDSDVVNEDEQNEKVQWIVTRGAPPSVASLEEKLDEVKALYAAKTGHDVDADSDDEFEEPSKDSIQWSVTRGAVPSVSSLDRTLSE